MNEPVARETTQLDALDTEFESQAALQLRRGFPWLKFRGPLEREFRQAYLEQIRGQMRFNLLLAFVCMAAFFVVGHLTLGESLNSELDWLRISLVTPA